ncbi:MAG: phospholipase D family protein [Formosimonas sp.]
MPETGGLMRVRYAWLGLALCANQAWAEPTIRALFSPQDNVQGEIVRQLAGAKKQILVQAYLLTDNTISDALIAAHKRGVQVKVLLDAERERSASGSDGQRLTDAGIKVRLETQYENAHNKVMIVDGQSLITGSYNFTYAAQYKNAENVLLIQNAPQLVRRYVDNWQMHNRTAVDFKP